MLLLHAGPGGIVQMAYPGTNAATAVTPCDQRSPKWETLCPDSSRTRMRNLTPLSFSDAEKSVTVQTKKTNTQ